MKSFIRLISKGNIQSLSTRLYPLVLVSFLETDIVSRSHYYDIIKCEQIPGSYDIDIDKKSNFSYQIHNDSSNYLLREQKANKIYQIIAASWHTQLSTEDSSTNLNHGTNNLKNIALNMIEHSLHLDNDSSAQPSNSFDGRDSMSFDDRSIFSNSITLNQVEGNNFQARVFTDNANVDVDMSVSVSVDIDADALVSVNGLNESISGDSTELHSNDTSNDRYESDETLPTGTFSHNTSMRKSADKYRSNSLSASTSSNSIDSLHHLSPSSGRISLSEPKVRVRQHSEFIPRDSETMDSVKKTNSLKLGNGKLLVQARDRIQRVSQYMLSSNSLNNHSPAKIPSIQELLELPGVLLQELAELVKFVSLSDSSSVGLSDYLDRNHSIILDCRLKQISLSETTAPFPIIISVESDITNSTNQSYKAVFCWLSQWRVHRILYTCSAFADITSRMAAFKYLHLRHLPNNLTDNIKTSFLLNLYNLMSLHAAIMIPWPSLNDSNSRIQWLYATRYQIGSNHISLLQLEHWLLRSQSIQNLEHLPSIPGASEVSILSTAYMLIKLIALSFI